MRLILALICTLFVTSYTLANTLHDPIFCTNDGDCPVAEWDCQSSKCIFNPATPGHGVCSELTSYCGNGEVCHCNDSGSCISEAQWWIDCVIIPNREREKDIQDPPRRARAFHD